MKSSIQNKLDSLLERHEELSGLLSDPSVIADQPRFRAFSKEYAELEPIVLEYRHYKEAVAAELASESLMKDPDLEMRKLAEEEWKESKTKVESLAHSLNLLLLPKDPNDQRNIYLEIRAGAGGEEAALFSGVLFRMYSRFRKPRMAG